MEKVAKLLGLKDDATEEEIVAKIEESQQQIKELQKTNETLVQTNNTLAVSEAGKQARIDELEKAHRELLESSTNDKEDAPKTDIERLAEIK